MKAFHFRLLAFCASLLACGMCEQGHAQQESTDTTGSQLVAPELILQYKERLKLSQAQQDGIQALIDSAKGKLPSLQEQLKAETEALRNTLQTSLSNEKAVLSQLDKVIAKERNIKRLQLALLIRVHNRLNEQQQADLENVKVEIINQRRDTQQRIQSKLQKAQRLVQQKTKEGSPPNDVVEMMRPFGQLLREGKVQEAEALLDRATSMLAPTDGSLDLPSAIDGNLDIFSQ